MNAAETSGQMQLGLVEGFDHGDYSRFYTAWESYFGDLIESVDAGPDEPPDDDGDAGDQEDERPS
ncbi:MAG: hypothetical protein ACR2RE_12885 [Geminicoccaceae bacterium]